MRRLLAAIAIAATLVGSAQAQTYPSLPVTIVVPFPAGGPTDALARVLAERMKGALGQSVIVENPTGGAGPLGTGPAPGPPPPPRPLPPAFRGGGGCLGESISGGGFFPVWFVAKAALPPKDLA